MKVTNILLVGFLSLGSTVALAEDGYGRSLEAVQKFRANQERIHGKDKSAAQVEDKKAAATEQASAKTAESSSKD